VRRSGCCNAPFSSLEWYLKRAQGGGVSWRRGGGRRRGRRRARGRSARAVGRLSSPPCVGVGVWSVGSGAWVRGLGYLRLRGWGLEGGMWGVVPGLGVEGRWRE